jgi:hypothetical protein
MLALPIHRRADYPVRSHFDAFTTPRRARAAGGISHVKTAENG